MLRRARYGRAGVIALVSLLLAACGGGARESGQTAGEQVAGQLIFPIGVVTSLSPPGLVDLGRDAKEAIEAFVKWNNAHGSGVRFEIVGIEDDRGDPAVAREAVDRLISKGAKAILGDMSSAIATAAEPVAVQQNVLYMIGGSWADELTGKDRPMAFRVGASNSGLARHGLLPYLEYLHSERGVQSVGLLTEDSPYGLGMSDQLVKLVEENIPGLVVHNEVFPANSTDVTAQLLRLKNASPPPDVVIIIAIGPARNLAIPQAYEVGLAPHAKLVANWNWPTYPDYWKVVGKYGVGVEYVDFEAPNTELTEMGRILADQIGKRPSIWAEWAWDAALALREAILAGRTVDTTKLVSYLEKVNFEGASGPVSFWTEGPAFHDRKELPTYVLVFRKEGDTASDAEVVFSAG